MVAGGYTYFSLGSEPNSEVALKSVFTRSVARSLLESAEETGGLIQVPYSFDDLREK